MDKANCPICRKYINVPINTDNTYRDFHCPNCGEILRSRMERHIVLESRCLLDQSSRLGKTEVKSAFLDAINMNIAVNVLTSGWIRR